MKADFRFSVAIHTICWTIDVGESGRITIACECKRGRLCEFGATLRLAVSVSGFWRESRVAGKVPRRRQVRNTGWSDQEMCGW
jgi:hypothetical protein